PHRVGLLREGHDRRRRGAGPRQHRDGPPVHGQLNRMAASRRSRIGLAVLAGALLAGCARQGATVQGQEIHDLYVLVIILAAPVFVGVEGALLWCVVRFRRRGGDAARPVPQWVGGPRSLGVFFAIPTVIVAFFFLYGERTLADVQRREPNPAVGLGV